MYCYLHNGVKEREEEREKLRDFIINFGGQATYETKNIIFHIIHVKVSSNSRCLRTLPMNIAMESDTIKRNLCKDWVWSKMCGKAQSNVKGKTLYRSVILILPKTFQTKLHSQLFFS